MIYIHIYVYTYIYVGVPRSQETPTPLGSPQVPRHRASVGSYGGSVSYERGTPVDEESLRNHARTAKSGRLLDGQARSGLSHLYRGTSLIRNTAPVGPYSSPVPRNLW